MGYRIRSAWLAFGAGATLAACGGGRPDYSALSTPPEVSFVTPPPTYTASVTLPIGIAARNPTGVRAVYALTGSQRFAAKQQGDGTWVATVQLPVIGKNTVTVWAEDMASPMPNSGQGMDPPYQLVQDVVYDPTPPSVSYDASFPSYSDERTLELEIDLNGVAKVPAAYVAGPKVGVQPGGDFYKAWSRLSGGADMTASELETMNASNIPVLRFVVPYNRNTDSPVQTPTFVAHVSCPPPCPVYPDATGELLPSATPDDQRALFDLPLATETIPALASLLGPADVSISLTVADAAGNAVTVPGFNFKFHAIGPPLALVEDTQYPAAAKPESTFVYHLADNTYGVMWTLGAQFGSNVVRLIRYFITNPTPEPVAVQLDYAQDARGSWQAVETWNRFSAGEPTGRNADGNYYLNVPSSSVAFTMDGFTFHNPTYWEVPYGTMTGTLSQGEYGPHPCGSPSGGYILHRMGDRTNKYVCSADFAVNLFTTTPETAAFSTSDVAIRPYRISPELQGQERDPDLDPSGRWFLVPPAAGAVPGTLVVYLARPVLAQRTRPLQWNAAVSSPPANIAVNHYQDWDYEFWWGYYQPASYLYPGYDTYILMRMGAYLTAAQENLYGTLLATTQAYMGTNLLGEPAPRLSVDLAREPLATH
ncbi:hypothetical protein A2cp1_1146 [Anaeromyxobacter dehalogenans 2CP-1]|uniref:Lipoprotein n=1 Tax=Anaeromyxobacter dehalogenans (strain ATCC BAA-258 / DSM 21875 / 2CP-1) TaxID=455488 RepID=B8JFQ3_ANAD2|nr:hypothetical protein [Anaeromyxobacter dehalogenans]ACL64491.1 hypothetical protein A2cp1_1146 [Anaeromyxobacter dehalogenans 2CP-1]